MTSSLLFQSAARYERGAVCSILATCRAGLLDSDVEHRLHEFDREVFENRDPVGACTLITSVDSDIMRPVSYDPRQGPRVGIVGHNGVPPLHPQKGYGVQQTYENPWPSSGDHSPDVGRKNSDTACHFVDVLS